MRYRSLILLTLCLVSCNNIDSRFEKKLSDHTGISFQNTLSYTEDFNPYTYRNFFNGGGVALGDINNDGLIDIYFTGNIVDNALYLNKGNWQFDDITDIAGVSCKDNWSTGATFVDINQDGLLDLYVTKSGKPGGENRHNELFINNGDLTFKESSSEYGLDIEGLSVHAAFFDYDGDLDLDAYVLNNSIRSVGSYDLIEGQRNIPSQDGNQLLENRNNKFENVSSDKGIFSSNIGFGLGITLSDFNGDLWPDLFISNDFFEKDYLYLNNNGGGALLHAVYFEADVEESDVPRARKFKLEWENPDNQTFILGLHLFFFGVACIWFVEWARIHGIYDPAIGAVRLVNYNLDLTMIWNRQFDFIEIDSLEDVMGGHAFLAFAELTGATIHMVAGSTQWENKRLGEWSKFKGAELLSAEAVLSWSLAGIGWMAIVAAFWAATNTTVYPTEWFGEPLKLQFSVAPYWVDTGDLSDSAAFFGHSTRAALVNVHYYFGFFFLQGHFWHALRALGFDFKKVADAIGNSQGATVRVEGAGFNGRAPR